MYIAEAAILVRKAVAYSIGSSLLDNVIGHSLPAPETYLVVEKVLGCLWRFVLCASL